MARSNATTVEAYLNELPADQRVVIAAVRDLILQNLPEGYQEAMTWGMPSYEVPLAQYPHTYNGKPLCYISLSAQKNYFALYLLAVYQDSAEFAALKAAFEQAGKKFDMGKSCLRFHKLDDLPLDVIAQVIAGTSPADFIARYEASRKK